MGLLTRCERCGRFHGADERCRPKWGRRGFLAMLGAIPTMAATGLPAWADPPPPLKRWMQMSVAYTANSPIRLRVSVLWDGEWESCVVQLPRVKSLKEHQVRFPIDASGRVLARWDCRFESDHLPFEYHSVNGNHPIRPISTTGLSFYQDARFLDVGLLLPDEGWVYR